MLIQHRFRMLFYFPIAAIVFAGACSGSTSGPGAAGSGGGGVGGSGGSAGSDAGGGSGAVGGADAASCRPLGCMPACGDAGVALDDAGCPTCQCASPPASD